MGNGSGKDDSSDSRDAWEKQVKTLIAKGQFRTARKLASEIWSGDDLFIKVRQITQDVKEERQREETRRIVRAELAIPAAASTNLFVRRGREWEVAFEGEGPKKVPHLRGMDYIHALLTEPETPIGSAVLAESMAAREKGADIWRIPRMLVADDVHPRTTSRQDALDPEALKAYLDASQHIRGQMEEAKERQDHKKFLQLRAEYQFIETQLSRDTFDGKTTSLNDPDEKSRKKVSEAIERAITKITEVLRPLGSHLRAHIRCGRKVRYSPPDDVKWHVGP